ncbi:outer membrane protein [Flavobacterium sp.]|uniref:outer membrane protein n=1 Tax=Flavobacterium sp. TaxID=239 RepID=UPI003753D73B
MKKIILSAIMLMGLAFTAQAQDISKNAIGLRLGDNDGFGAEVSYQRGLSNSNRLELDLGWRNRSNYYNNGYYGNDDAIKLAGLYQWVWNIDGGFNWYAGVGGGFGSYNSDYNGVNDNGVFAFAAGDVGIEYNFDFPLQLSLDFRPELGGNGYYENSYSSDIALGVRYRF